ncbi:energy transducer TonB [Vibrio sp. 16]|uniref:energy transducer TonB n=1 Tax=Vibrio sp. 16 TaxID=391586 RepID=UPI002FF1922E
MNLKRYSIAGGVSLAIHAAFLFVAHESKSFAMPTGSDTPTVSLKFAPTPSPKVEQAAPSEPQEMPPVEKAVEPPPPVEPPPVKKAVEKAPIEKPKKAVKKEKPKPVKKKPEVKKAPPKKPTPVKKDTPKKEQPKPVVEEKVAKKVEENKPASKEVKSDAASRPGATENPVLVERPSFLTKPRPPKYPRIAQKRGIEGVAKYEIWLDENGNQIKQVLISSSGATILDKAALDAIKKWKFSPHTVGGKTVAHRVEIPVRFKLD